MIDLAARIEAVLFWKTEPLSYTDLAKMLEVGESEVTEALATLRSRLENRGVQLVENNNTVMLGTHPAASELIEKVTKEELNRDLGKAGLETLTIVLYKGPITRAELDYIRGVNSTFILRNLAVRGLIEKVPNPHDNRSFLYQPAMALWQHLGLTKQGELPEFEAVTAKLAALTTSEHDN